MRAKAWYIHFPLDAYALGPIRWDRPVGEREVRKYARQWDKVTRLPAGFSCWPA